ncbi:D-alanyl-D-alanine carboxypeptidase family protein [Sediminibacillus dalangtanensis]|uniref:D-alanyl-D-alanine carboxypeptidase family protein n=1 Tax=Sediminibacillus dalangtanensis TaxID=2729421 RepID=UPI001FD754DF|nr:D-alanyl-D-alanine carboxypeptidase family protein [Sediminibacillus dalangtanensis]
MKQLCLLLLTIFTHFLLPSNVEAADLEQELLSESGILIDADTGQVLYEKNAEKSMYPASLTKVATAIYAIETADMDEMVTVSAKARAVEGTRVYLEEGEQVPLKKLIQGMLINSGNDAGVAIAEHLGGTSELFAEDLNSYLQAVVGVRNTHFTNAHGLFNENHTTTASDLAKTTQYAMKNSTFREIFRTKKLKWEGEAWSTTLYHHHKMIRENPYEGITGGKTGYVDESGHTLITTAKRSDLRLIAVTLKAESQAWAYQDAEVLLDFGFDHFETVTVPEGTKFTSDNGTTYRTGSDIVYSKMKGQDAELSVDDQGTLAINQDKESLDTSFVLEGDKEKQEAEKNKKAAADHTDKQSSFSYLWIIVMAGIGLLFFRKWIKRVVM